MKSKILLSFIGISIITTLIVIWVSNVNANKPVKDNPVLTLKVTSDKQTYVQGEPVKLTFEVLNETDKPISLSYRPDVTSGYLKVWIAFDGQRFNQYNNTSWGLSESGGSLIQPGKSFKSEAEILWNNKPDTSRLNINSIKNSREGAILNHYAFPNVGSYLIKVILTMPDDAGTKIESEPIQIFVNEPVGDDLKVWNLIKDRGDIAYFIQQEEVPSLKEAEKEKLLREVEQIASDHPNSLLTARIKQGVEKFRMEEKKRKDRLEKARVKPKN